MQNMGWELVGQERRKYMQTKWKTPTENTEGANRKKNE